MQPTHKPGIYSAAREQKPSGLPALDTVSAMTNRKARDIIERAGYQVTGYTLTHKNRPAKCILDMANARWITLEDLQRVMEWKKPTQHAPIPAGFEPPPEDVSEGERALQQTAMRLGIGYSALIPHNTGWFIPAHQNAYASAGEAIEALFELVYTAPDATVYRPGKAARGTGAVVVAPPPVAAPVAPPAPKPAKVREPEAAPQLGLF
jgi:hypothetical protein